ncbi:unnamed protein product [Closterium sp. Yama58-4]|nr:unnamed protein product [Closterium sp. Yama58-4]
MGSSSNHHHPEEHSPSSLVESTDLAETMSGPTRAVGGGFPSKADGETPRNLEKAGESTSPPGSAERPEVSGDVGNELNETVASQADGEVAGQSGSEDGSRRRTPFTENSQLEADLALARAIQEQECAFMMLYHQQALAAASASASGSRAGSRGSSRRLQGRQDRQDRQDRQTGSSVDNPIVLLSEGEELEADDPDDEEEFADADDDEYGEWEEASEDDGETGEDGEMGETGERGGEAANEVCRESSSARSTSLQRQLFQNGGSEAETSGNPSGVLRGEAARQGAGEGEEGSAGGEAGEGGEGAYEDDEAFARALQEEEEREMARRLFAMAGLQLSDGRGSSSRRRAEMLAAAHGVAWPFGEGEGDEESEEEDSEEEDGQDEDALDVDEMTYEELTALGEVIGTESKGLAQATINALPRVAYSTKSPLRRGEDMCAICQLEYEEGEELLLLPPCHHSYHEACVLQWLGRNKVCPVCKEESARRQEEPDHAAAMQHDDVIWGLVGKGPCSYRVKQQTDTFCRHPFNLNAICKRGVCPLANSRYATVREHDGELFLYMKTIERAHMPNKLWERVKLPRNYTKALEAVDKFLQWWPPRMVSLVKLRLTRLTQYLIRMRRLAVKIQPKLVTMPTKMRKRDEKREAKAETAAKIDRAIEKELLQRLQSGTGKGAAAGKAGRRRHIELEYEEEREQAHAYNF